jgi:biotin synthase
MQITDLIKKSQNNEKFSKEQIIKMLSCPPDSGQTLQIFAEALRISKKLCSSKAETHAQFALNLAPCRCNCKFCSFSAKNKIFNDNSELTPDKAVEVAKTFEKNNANAIFIMATANYSFKKLLDIIANIKQNLKKQTILIANVGDRTLEEAKELKKTNITGVYHALRLREGKDTDIDPQKRINSIKNFKKANLAVGTCVEPVGPEHTNEEIADMILFCSSVKPAFSGAARRITVPKGPLEKFGMISEIRMAQIVAVTRIATDRSVIGNCTHEPCTLGALAGANLFWAEVGANPRDTNQQTEQARGATVEKCRNIFKETNWQTRTEPSIYFK